MARIITVKMPEAYIDGLDELVKMKRYASRSEAIRIAVRELLRRELWGEDSIGIPVPAKPRRYSFVRVYS